MKRKDVSERSRKKTDRDLKTQIYEIHWQVEEQRGWQERGIPQNTGQTGSEPGSPLKVQGQGCC